MSDEIKLMISAVLKNQEMARAEQEAFRRESNAKIEGFRNEMNERFDDMEGKIIGIKRHLLSLDNDLNRTIIRVENLEHQANH